MKLILQHGAQSVEYEFKTRDGVTLTNQQATAVINAAYLHWKDILTAPEDPTLLQKAAFVLEKIADHMAEAARRIRRRELETQNEAQIRLELG